MLLSFLKKNGSMIVKLMVNQLGMAIFGFSVIGAITMYAGEGSDSGLLIGVATAVSVLFYSFIIFVITNDVGASDKIRVDAGRMERDNLLGLKWALCSNIINYILAVVILIAHFAGADELYGTVAPITALIQAPFMGLPGFMPNNPLAFFIMPAVPTAVCTLGYYLGLKGFLFIPEKKKRQ